MAGWSTTLFQYEKSPQILRWIALEFCTDVYGSHRMNPNEFGDPLLHDVIGEERQKTDCKDCDLSDAMVLIFPMHAIRHCQTSSSFCLLL